LRVIDSDEIGGGKGSSARKTMDRHFQNRKRELKKRTDGTWGKGKEVRTEEENLDPITGRKTGKLTSPRKGKPITRSGHKKPKRGIKRNGKKKKEGRS